MINLIRINDFGKTRGINKTSTKFDFNFVTHNHIKTGFCGPKCIGDNSLREAELEMIHSSSLCLPIIWPKFGLWMIPRLQHAH